MRHLKHPILYVLLALLVFSSCAGSGKSKCGCPSLNHSTRVNTKPLKDRDL